MMNINQLPVDCLVWIFDALRSPTDLLRLRVVCRRWLEPLRISSHKIRYISLLASDSFTEEMGEKSADKLLRDAYHRDGLSLHDATYRIKILPSRITPEMVAFFVDTFPFVESIEIVQLLLHYNLPLLKHWLTKLAARLVTLRIVHQCDGQQIPSEINSLMAELGNETFKNYQFFEKAINDFVSILSVDVFVKLRHLTIVDHSIYNRDRKISAYPLPDLSLLETLAIHRPFDPHFFSLRRIVDAAGDKRWPNLRHLALDTGYFGDKQIPNQSVAVVAPMFAELRTLSIDTQRKKLLADYIRPYCGTNLTTLHLIGVDFSQLPTIATYISDLAALRRLRISLKKFHYESNDFRSANICRNIRYLRMDFSYAYHSIREKAPFLFRLFPCIVTLVIDQELGNASVRSRGRKKPRLTEFSRHLFIAGIIGRNWYFNGALRRVMISIGAEDDEQAQNSSEENSCQKIDSIERYYVFDVVKSETRIESYPIRHNFCSNIFGEEAEEGKNNNV